MTRIPFQNLTSPNSFNIVRTDFVRIFSRIDRDDGNNTFVEHRKHDILNKSSGCLIDVRFKSQTIVKTRVNSLDISSILINSNVLNCNCSNIKRDTIVNRRSNRPLVSSRKSGTIWSIRGTDNIYRRHGPIVLIKERVPSMHKPGTE